MHMMTEKPKDVLSMTIVQHSLFQKPAFRLALLRIFCDASATQFKNMRMFLYGCALCFFVRFKTRANPVFSQTLPRSTSKPPARHRPLDKASSDLLHRRRVRLRTLDATHSEKTSSHLNDGQNLCLGLSPDLYVDVDCRWLKNGVNRAKGVTSTRQPTQLERNNTSLSGTFVEMVGGKPFCICRKF